VTVPREQCADWIVRLCGLERDVAAVLALSLLIGGASLLLAAGLAWWDRRRTREK
jgi:hypothetical protein